MECMLTTDLASKKLGQRIWPDYTKHFKSSTTAASYRADIQEFMEFCGKDFLRTDREDAERYYLYLKERQEHDVLGTQTVSKKIRELHSFAGFIEENRTVYAIREEFQDHFRLFISRLERQEKLAGSIPVEHVDALFRAAEDNLMAYTIFTLLYRVSLSSTEIAGLRIGDFAAYDDGVYVLAGNRREPCFVPDDAAEVLERYLEKKATEGYLFCNSRGKKLNVMFISRLMKKYTLQAGIPGYSAQELKNSCAFTLFAYGAGPEETARQLGITVTQIKRYRGRSYRENMMRKANELVKLKVEPPGKQ
ncbi:hypothetical protein HMPREF0980_00791 [Dorea sp. D27]|nr:hypothetical protein HMPREF0980_00791 [Dorea sp. D27]